MMGVCGSAKSTLAALLAGGLGSDVAQATTSTAKHRRPGLEKIANWIGNHAASGTPGIVTCSALRRVHRDRLRGLEVAFVRLHGDSQLIAQTIRRYGVPVRCRPGGVVDPGAGCCLAGPRRADVD